ncbi:MAG: hypothetical protein ABW072_16365 [Sedimenticola sp.]
MAYYVVTPALEFFPRKTADIDKLIVAVRYLPFQIGRRQNIRIMRVLPFLARDMRVFFHTVRIITSITLMQNQSLNFWKNY